MVKAYRGLSVTLCVVRGSHATKPQRWLKYRGGSAELSSTSLEISRFPLCEHTIHCTSKWG